MAFLIRGADFLRDVTASTRHDSQQRGLPLPHSAQMITILFPASDTAGNNT